MIAQTIFNWFVLVFVCMIALAVGILVLYIIIGMMDQILCGIFRELATGYRTLKSWRKNGSGHASRNRHKTTGS